MEVCGFRVVRKPEENYGEFDDKETAEAAPRIGDAFYSGFERMGWFHANKETSP